MGSTTPNLGLYKPGYQEPDGGGAGWPALVNANWDVLDDAVGGAGSGGEGMAVFAQPGVLVAGNGVARFLFPFTATLKGAVACVNTAPTGATIIVDVNLNGVTIYTTTAHRPTIAAGAFATTTQPTPDVTAAHIGDYLTVDIDQIGSTIAGADLTIQVLYTAP